MELVAFLDRQKRYDDAVDFLEQTWKNPDPIALVQVSVKIATDAREQKAIVERVQKLLENAAQGIQRSSGDHPHARRHLRRRRPFRRSRGVLPRGAEE